jgi:hypothetical protein
MGTLFRPFEKILDMHLPDEIKRRPWKLPVIWEGYND